MGARFRGGTRAAQYGCKRLPEPTGKVLEHASAGWGDELLHLLRSTQQAADGALQIRNLPRLQQQQRLQRQRLPPDQVHAEVVDENGQCRC